MTPPGTSMRTDAAPDPGVEARLALVRDALARVRAWLEARDYAGVEPHDALTSPLLARTPLGRSRLIRLTALQALRRLPFDVRPLLGIRPRVNAVSLGWALRAYALLDDEAARERIEWALAELRRLRAPGYRGAGWGYYFDWQTRATFKPANQPIIVSTAFIGLGLMDVFERYGRADCLELAIEACEFITTELNRTPGERGFAFSYGPDDHEQVFNASMLGAELLARAGAAADRPDLLELARAAVEFTVDHQNPDGSWRYGLEDHWAFVDNFHTGYVLISLREYARASGDSRFDDAIERGARFYRDNFFDESGKPKYYHDRIYPIDAHAAAQAVLTLVEFGDREAALRTAEWAIRNMQRPDGHFIYRIGRRLSNRIPYLRWSNALMPYALARLLRVW